MAMVFVNTKWFKKPEGSALLGRKPYGPMAGLQERHLGVRQNLNDRLPAYFQFSFKCYRRFLQL